jgi:signal transduction histidine kinase
MHYTGMAAAYFFATSGSPCTSGLQPTLLAVLVAVATALILGLAMFVAMVDRRLKAATRSARISQSRLMEAIESISEGFGLYDRDDRLVVSNSHYRELLDHGQDPVEPDEQFEASLRRAVSRGLIPVAESRVDTWIAQRLARHQNPLEPFVEKRSDGRCIRISEHKTQEGGTVAVYSDITELSLRNQELEAVLLELRQTQNQLVMKEKMASLGQLVAGVCHEINNPIGAINSAVQVLAKCVEKLSAMCMPALARSGHDVNEEAQKLLNLVHDGIQTTLIGGQRVARIVAGMKTFSGLDHAEFQKADIHEALDTTLMLLDHKLKDRVKVLKQYGELPGIYCYPNRLNQVFMNLLLNAAQAIEGEGTIWVKTESADDLLRVTITDNGRGIPPEHLGRVFDPGFTTKGVGVGTGLGLSICYSIVQDHGGRIGVTSQPGTGSSFQVILPRDLDRRLNPKEMKLYPLNSWLRTTSVQ